MNLPEFLKTWEGTQAENRWGRLIQGGLLVVVLVLGLLLYTKETIVTVQPFTLTEEATILKDDASRSYKEAWGWALALMLGNVSPANVDFIKDRISPILSPSIYFDVMDALGVQARQVREDRVTMRFEPRFVEYEPSTDKVFVYGYSFVRGSNSEEQRVDRTYEYSIQIANYAPLLDGMTTYTGMPRTEEVKLRMERNEELRSGREE